MNWRLTLFGSPNFAFYPARIGTMFNFKGGVPDANEYPASGIKTTVSARLIGVDKLVKTIVKNSKTTRFC